MKLAIPTLLALSHLTTTLAAHDQPKQENLSRVLDADLEANPQARQVLEDQGMLKEGEERKLSNSYSSSSSSSGADAYGYNYYSNTDQTEYDGYQQAWRYLGWYVSCGTPSDRYYASNSHDSQGSNDNTYEGNNYCQRYLMWAGVSRLMENLFDVKLVPYISHLCFSSAVRRFELWRRWYGRVRLL